MNRATEPGDAPFALTPRKARPNAVQVAQRVPEELFGHLRWSMAVGMRQGIARRRPRPADSGQWPGVQPQTVTNIIEPNGMSELRKQQRHDVTPGTKVAGSIGRACAAGQLADQMSRNEIAQLPKDREFGPGWLVLVFFHPCRVAG